MRVYTYYENINFTHQSKVIEMWINSWAKHNFHPIVLNENDARKSHLYESYSLKIRSFPSVNAPGFDYHCFMRYLAVLASCSSDDIIISTEPDVMNYNLYPEDVKQMKKINMIQYSVVPALHVGDKEGYVNFCNKLLDHNMSDHDNFMGRPHLSDQDFIARYGIIERIYPNNYVAEVFEDGYLEKPVVHFGSPYMNKRGYIPKDLYIEQIRPFS